jgi:hypothetical protein
LNTITQQNKDYDLSILMLAQNTVAELINQLDDQIEELASFKDSITVYIDELAEATADAREGN